tara:strand:+ start:654 stop:1106 length:453 start_codon:yes stop_codon:yes gene_type:complete
MTEQATKKPEEKKNPLQKIKAKIDDKEEQLEIVTTLVKLGVLVWAGFIISLNYLPSNIFGKTEPKDITFIASIFTGALAGFNISTGKKRGDGTYNGENAENKPMSKKEIEAMLRSQDVIRINNKFTLVPQGTEVNSTTNKPVDPESGRLT